MIVSDILPLYNEWIQGRKQYSTQVLIQQVAAWLADREVPS